MAISYKGAVSADASAGNGNTSITIPADSTLAVVVQTFWDSGAGQLSTVTLDSQSGTFFQQNSVSGNSPATAGAIITGFTTGASKTLAWTYTSDEAVSEGAYIYVLFFDGADSTVVASDADANEGATAVSISLNNTDTSHYGVVLAQAFTGSDPDLDQPTGSTRTLVYDNDDQNSHATDVAYYTYSTTGAKTYNVANEDYSSIVGLILQESSAGEAVTFDLVDITGSAQANLSSVRWSWFNEPDPANFNAPSDQGTAETTDGTGEMVLSLPNTTLTSGQTGFLVLRDSANNLIGGYRLDID